MFVKKILLHCFLFNVILCVGDTLLHAQDKPVSRVTGVVTDAATKEPLPGATIRISQLGAVSNIEGRYTIERVPQGEIELTATFTGYQSETVRATLGETELSINFQLKIANIEKNEIEVLGYQNRQLKEDTRTGVIRIEASQIKTMPGGAEDLMRSMQAMPGVGSVNDLSSQLVIRGSAPSQNLTIIDNIEFFSPYKLYGAFSVFNPDIVSNVNLITSSFPAKYGDRLSAVLDVANRSGTINSFFNGTVNLNTYYANVSAEGKIPTPYKGSSWIAAFRRSYIEYISYPLAKLIDPSYKNTADEIPNTTDFQLKADFSISAEHIIQFSGIITADYLNADDITKKFGVNWFFVPESRGMQNTLSFNTYYYNTELEYRRNIVDVNYPTLVNYEELYSMAKVSLAKYSLKDAFVFDEIENHVFEFGIGVDYFHNDVNALVSANASKSKALDLQYGQGADRTALTGKSVGNFGYWRSHLYAQDKIKLFSNKLFLEPGIRLDYFGLMNKFYVSPRFNFSYELAEETILRGGAGLFYQSPGYEKLISGTAFIDFTSIDPNSLPNLSAERAIHIAASVEHTFDKRWSLKGEGYIKWMNELIDQNTNPASMPQTNYLGGDPYSPNSWRVSSLNETYYIRTAELTNKGSGLAYGFDVFLMKKATRKTMEDFFDRLDGWISYSFGISKLTNSESNSYFSNYDQTHSVSFVLSYRILDWLIVGGQLKVATGVPFTRLELKPRLADNKRIATSPTGRTLFDLVYKQGTQNADRYPTYIRLDVRVVALAKIFDATCVFYLDVINVLNNHNILKYEYNGTATTSSTENPIAATLNPIRMIPLVPGFGATIKF
ncbi:hypothetical protein CHS0354_000613 [Potamilus streckersoni]|uniref:TonB-dependent receptor plug domain-containing protein n=1 Tax=Potamilus streckersoni TaxID=2493646 RepID=A0AAE0W8F8_9BIVA|nr:hypothetical protein CHS0354_000613 [Potamilus streckersoni]